MSSSDETDDAPAKEPELTANLKGNVAAALVQSARRANVDVGDHLLGAIRTYLNLLELENRGCTLFAFTPERDVKKLSVGGGGRVSENAEDSD